jgi:hypothetical protein
MTRSGVVYERPMQARRTDGSASSSLLKTPTSQLAINGGSQHPQKRKAGGHGPTLADEVEHLLPTPVVTDSSSSARHTTTTGRMRSGTSLTDALRLLPTPNAAVSNDGERPETWLARKERVRAESGASNGIPLTIAVQLIGARTNPQFADGSTFSDGEPRHRRSRPARAAHTVSHPSSSSG